MGLDIHGKVSKKDYHFGYSGIHLVRWLALRVCGAPEKFENGNTSFTWITHPWINPTEKQPTVKDLNEWQWALQKGGYYFPNLLFHSDAEGTYTKRGKVFQRPNLMSGNSIGLLKELRMIKEELKNIKYDKDEKSILVFNTLFDLVRDEVENGNGHITFS